MSERAWPETEAGDRESDPAEGKEAAAEHEPTRKADADRGGLLPKIALAVLALAMLGGLIAVFLSRKPPFEGRGYNVVLISMDTTRRDHLTMYGYEPATTPRLGELAERGVVFENAVAVHTNTAPAHASMMTGHYPGGHGILLNGQRLSDAVTTLGERLGEAGYVTAGFISGWTLTEHTGIDRGFDHYDQELPGDGRRNAEQVVDAVLSWLERDATEDRPFFLFVHSFDPHYPYRPPEEFANRFLPEGEEFRTRPHPRAPGPRGAWPARDRMENRIRYDAEIAYADHHFGRMIEAIEAHSDRETIFIFTSDHGETLDERAWVFDHGGRAYDEQLRIPMVIRMPGNQHAGTRVRSQSSQVDITPTVLAALELPPAEDVAGHSLLGVMAEETPEDLQRPVYALARCEPRRIPELRPMLSDTGLIRVIRLPTIKLIEYPASTGTARQLFDLEADPGELRDLADTRWEMADRLHEHLQSFQGASIPDEEVNVALDAEIEEGLRVLGYLE